MTARERVLRAAAWSAAGGFALGWAAKGLSIPPPKIVEPLPPLVAVAPQNAPVKPPPPGAKVLSDGRIVTPLDAPDPTALVLAPPAAPAAAPKKRRR